MSKRVDPIAICFNDALASAGDRIVMPAAQR